jgi:hypothetical protein
MVIEEEEANFYSSTKDNNDDKSTNIRRRETNGNTSNNGEFLLSYAVIANMAKTRKRLSLSSKKNKARRTREGPVSASAVTTDDVNILKNC